MRLGHRGSGSNDFDVDGYGFNDRDCYEYDRLLAFGGAPFGTFGC